MIALTETELGSIILMITDLVRSCFDFLSGFILVTFGGVPFSLLDLLVSTAFLWLLVDFIHDLRSPGRGSSADERGTDAYGRPAALAPQPGYETERFYGRRR